MEAIKLICSACGQANRVPLDKVTATPRCGICNEPLADGRVRDLDGETHDKIIRSDGLPVLIDYWAPWCGPCRVMAPEFAKAAPGLAAQVRFLKLNTQDYPEIAARARIQGIPALVLYKNGREVARLAGARSAQQIKDFARQVVH